jgi:hypothetical protein
MKGILEKAAQAGRDQMLVSVFASARPIGSPGKTGSGSGSSPAGNFEPKILAGYPKRLHRFGNKLGCVLVKASGRDCIEPLFERFRNCGLDLLFAQ